MSSRAAAAVYYPPANHLEVLSIDRFGNLSVAWKVENGPWQGPAGVVGAGFAPPGAPVAAVSSGSRQQLEVFVVDAHGALNVVWKERNDPWHRPPFTMTPQGFAPRYGSVAAAHYLPYDQLEVFAVDTRGVLNVVWKERNDPWKLPVGLTDPGFAPAGAALSAVAYPVNDRLEVFLIDSAGALREIRKSQNQPWEVPPEITSPGLAQPGGSVAAAYYPPHEQLLVVFVDLTGALRGVWKEHDGRWSAPMILSTPDFPATASVAAVYYPVNEQLEVFAVDRRGAVRVAWRTGAGNWNLPAWLIPDEFAEPGAPLAAAHYPLGAQLELFVVNRADVMHGIAKANDAWWGPCPFGIEPWGDTPTPARPTLLGTARCGPLTGQTDPDYKLLFNHTAKWGMGGVDLGANTEHTDGRLYIFFGDVVSDGVYGDRPRDADAVAWIDAPKLGGHEAAGFDFVLPHDATPIEGQSEWRFCVKCHGLYYDGYADKGVCPALGTHAFHPASFNFSLPHDATPVDGQQGWRFCVKCHGLYYDGYPEDGVCPQGGGHRTHPDAYKFVLPHDDTPVQGQGAWRFCGRCYGLFFDGYDPKGVCSAGGQAFHIHPVLSGAFFDPFTVDGPIGLTLTEETPTGAFSYEGLVFVFIWVGSPRGAKSAGSYLVSKQRPDLAGPFTEEFFFSPKTVDPKAVDSKRFWQVAPVVVDHAKHPGLFPMSNGEGLVLFGHGPDAALGSDAVHLGWMPLRPRAQRKVGDGRVGPIFEQARYFNGDPDPGGRWAHLQDQAVALFPRNRYTSLSAAWLEEPKRWVLLYSKANEQEAPTGAIVARFGTTPWSLSDEVTLFDPCAERAFGRYMHWPFSDHIRQSDPPGLNDEERPGWAYGAFLLTRFCRWDDVRRELTLYYLLSLSSPYQVQVMVSRLHIPD
jgi:hypothetical protein